MKIKVITIAYNSTTYLRKLIETACNTIHDVEIVVFTHSNNQGMIGTLESMVGYPLNVFDYRQNRGVARSWNEGMLYAFEDGAEAIIVANDDVYFSDGDIEKIVAKAVNNRGNYMVSVAGPHDGLGIFRISHGYSCFALNPIALEKIGCFDENFHVAYGEDLDHHRRATMLGLVEENCPDTNVTHGGSMTLQNDSVLSLQNMATQRANLLYFRRKWDSDNHEGGYSTPFNDDKFDLRIDPEVRHAPYPGYNREDE